MIARARHAGIAALSPELLTETADQWLAPLLVGRRDLDVAKGRISDALLGLLDWDARQALDRLAPRHFTSPADTAHAIDYADPGGPSVEVRVQALFGLGAHPTLGDGTPLVLSLLSPAGRPIQTTRDLPGFWKGSWGAVAKGMRGRYPRHPWPDDPASANATLRTKNADARRAGSR